MLKTGWKGATVKKISSKENPIFKYLISLTRPQLARKQQRVLAEGLRLCRDLILSNVTIEQIIVSDHGLTHPDIKCFLASIPGVSGRPMPQTINLTDPLMKKLSQTKNTQGIAMVCLSPILDQPADPPDKGGLYLIADQVQDPGNLGTMIRTADAFDFAAVILIEGTVWPMNDKVMRASMGSVFHLPLISFPRLADAVRWLSQAHIPVIAADLDGDSCLDTAVPCPAALLISNEANGLSEAARQLADHLVSIPMPGMAESLNAAAAAAILSYEMMRLNKQRSVLS